MILLLTVGEQLSHNLVKVSQVGAGLNVRAVLAG